MAWHKTVRKTPQQNDLAKRMNMTILESVRCLLSHSGLPKFFWVEIATAAIHLINRSHSSTIGFKTSQEIWVGKLSNYDYLRVFGCVVYAHTRTDKLEPMAMKYIFIGYPKRVKGYNLWIDEPRIKNVSLVDMWSLMNMK